MMTPQSIDDAKRELVRRIGVVANELNQLLGDAAASGVEMEIEVIELKTHFVVALKKQIAIRHFRSVSLIEAD